MVTPLDKFDELADKFNITGDKRQATDMQLQFVREQFTQLKHIANRLLFDLTTSHLLKDEAKDETVISSYDSKINEYSSQLRQTSASMDAILQLQTDLENRLAGETKSE